MNSSEQEQSATGEEAVVTVAPRKRMRLKLWWTRRQPLLRVARGRQQDTSLFQTVFRNSVLLLALLVLGQRIILSRLSLAEFCAAFAITPLLLMLRATPVAWTRERPLTFVAPIVFATTLWIGPECAALSALLACALHARFGMTAGRSRSYVRFQGAQLALSACLGSDVLMAAGRWLHAPIEPVNQLPLMAGNGTIALNLFAAVTLSALAFTGSNLLLTTGANLGILRTQWNFPLAHKHFYGLALVYTLGMLPVALLAPVGANLGLAVIFPLILLLLLCAHTARLSLEIISLRGQLDTAEAMGRASIADDEDDVDPSALLRRFLTLAQELVVSERSIVWMMDQETGELTPAAAWPDMGVYGEHRGMYGKGLLGHAAERFRPRLIADAARDPRRGRREPASGSWLLYPIVVHNERLLGVAQWIRPTNRPFTPEDVARLDSLVPQAAVALENVRIREAMHNLASTDGLTGLWNHRRMHELLREEMRRATRYHRVLSVLMMDVDSFKTFNDTYGHPAGDQLLRTIASILRANVRNVDYVGRYGGEEFLVILPETSKDDACRMAERIRSAVEELAVMQIQGRDIRRTVSVGVASYPEDALNPGELVQQADDALYRAKRAGKNCVIWA